MFVPNLFFPVVLAWLKILPQIKKSIFFLSQDNLVGTVVVISLLIWIPASCLISWVDRQRAERDQKEWDWRRQDELIHPDDKRRIIHIRVPRRTVSLAAANQM
jgi:disintegrin and metalloproteinase domain-containing protein 17